MEKTLIHPMRYDIRVAGLLDRQFLGWSEDVTVIPQGNDQTLLIGRFPDQPALRGFLDQLWNLNYTLLSVEAILDDAGSPVDDHTPEESKDL